MPSRGGSERDMSSAYVPFLGIWIGSMIADDNPLTHPADAVG
jgi:hypothetical protein